MKTILTFFISALTMLSGCNQPPVEGDQRQPEISKGEPCSLRFSGIEFTKSLHGAKSLAAVEGDQLIFRSNARTDNFNEPDGSATYDNAPVLLTEIDNSKPFTFTAKVTPAFNNTYDAGAMYVYLNPMWWFKFAFERDERMKTRIVTVRTIDTSDDNNHDVIDQASVYMKISSDVHTIGFYYSLDKENWQLVRLYKNDYPAELWIGLSAQSPVGEGNTVTFEDGALIQSSVKDFRMGL